MKKTIAVLSIFALVVSGCKQNTKKQETNENVMVPIEIIDIKQSVNDSLLYSELQNEVILTESNVWDLISDKAKWFKGGLEPQKDTDLLPSDFFTFYEKFNTDSVFQINNIQFDRLIGVIGECDTTIILNPKNWEMEIDIIKNFNEYPKEKNEHSTEIWNNYFFSDSTRILFVFEITEVGIISQFGFEKINGKWKQTLSYVSVC